MINYIVGKNLGHLSRCVANLEELKKSDRKKVRVYAYKHSHRWLQKNLKGVKIRRINKFSYRNKAREFLRGKLLVHDWRGQVKYIKARRKKRDKCIIIGIYHSDLALYRGDTFLTKKFKRQIKDISEKTTDIFFHINLKQPTFIPKLTTLYVPIPIIARKVTMKPEKVKKKLGLKEHEEFILVTMGGGIGRYRYKYIYEWYKKINKLNLPYRIVVVNQFAGKKLRFRKGIIRAPLFRNGVDLVNAAKLVISKPGMGILTDCISTGTPLLALPADTKERKVKNMMLKDVLETDVCLVQRRDTHKDLERKIKEMIHLEEYIKWKFEQIPQNGAEIMAKSLKLLHKASRKNLSKVYKKILELTPFKIK